MGLGTAVIAALLILALACVAPTNSRSVPLPTSIRQSTVEAVDPPLTVEARVKFPVLGSGDQVLYVTVTRDRVPVKGAVAGIVVWYRSDKREFPKTVTGDDGKTVMDWDVGRPSGGFTLIEVTATHQGKTARTSTGFYPR